MAITMSLLMAISTTNLSGITVYGAKKAAIINAGTITNTGQITNSRKITNNGTIQSKTTVSNAEENAVEDYRTITITPNEHITVSDSKSLTQKVAVNEAMSTVVLTAEEDYYFPSEYAATFSSENSGITVTRDSASQITVSGTLSSTVTDDLTITLPAPTEKANVTITSNSNNCSITYPGGEINLAMYNPFNIPDGVGSQHYSVRGKTGEGSIEGTVLTVTKAGTFEITVTTDATSTHKAGHATTTLTVEKGKGNYPLQVKGDAGDIVYGDSYTAYAESTTNKDVTIYYKLSSAPDDTYSMDMPVNAGDYKVKAVFAETDLYKGHIAYANLTIKQADPEIISLPTITRTYDATTKLENIDLSECVVHGVDVKPLNGTWSWTTGNNPVLSVGTNTYSAKFTPSDNTNYKTVTANIPITIKPKELTVSGATAQNRPFNRNNLVVITSITLNGVTGNDEVSVDTNSMQGILNSIYTGTYNFVTLPQLTLTGSAKENYVLVQPTDAVATNVTIEKADAEITLNQNSYTKTFGDGDFTLDVTDTNTDIDVNYEVIYGKDVVSVSPDGIVTILKAGNATIQVSLPESQNFYAATSKTINIDIQKKQDYSIDIEKNYLYSASNTDTIDLTKYLPKDSGEVNWDKDVQCSIASSESYRVSYGSASPNVKENKLIYTVNAGTKDDTGAIAIRIFSENYSDIAITIHITLTDKSPVHLKKDSAVTLQNSVLTYGEPLSSLAFQSAVFVDDNGTEVAGTLAWKNPNSTASGITAYGTWVFTPNDTTTYASLEGTVAITVNKATPVLVSTPQVENDITYHPFDVVLKNSDLTGGKGNGSWK